MSRIFLLPTEERETLPVYVTSAIVDGEPGYIWQIKQFNRRWAFNYEQGTAHTIEEAVKKAEDAWDLRSEREKERGRLRKAYRQNHTARVWIILIGGVIATIGAGYLMWFERYALGALIIASVSTTVFWNGREMDEWVEDHLPEHLKQGAP